MNKVNFILLIIGIMLSSFFLFLSMWKNILVIIVRLVLAIRKQDVTYRHTTFFPSFCFASFVTFIVLAYILF